MELDRLTLEASMQVACRHRLIDRYRVEADRVYITLGNKLHLAFTVEEAGQFVWRLLRGHQHMASVRGLLAWQRSKGYS